MTIREETEQRELQTLSDFATRASESKGRTKPMEECPLRTCFQRDTDRIVHSKGFRRLTHKTQVFLRPEGDHYRTRMTHTLEVARIARTIARGLRLNEDLTEACALGHDLGHTPFGHAGERALDAVMTGGFHHNEQSLRVVDVLENGGQGLNLCFEVRQGILCHTKGVQAKTLEGQIIRLADRIAYINHDIDDALRGGIIYPMDIPVELSMELGFSHGDRIDTLVSDIIECSRDQNQIIQSPEKKDAMENLRKFMFKSVYRNPVAKGEEGKAETLVKTLFEYFVGKPEQLPADFWEIRIKEGAERASCDYIAGMTDKFAVETFKDLFVPHAWAVK
jgi:dGTPase